MECMKSIYHILIEKLRKQKRLTMVTVCMPDGTVTKTLEAPTGEHARLERNEDGSLCLREPFERQERLIVLGDGEMTRLLTKEAAKRGFAVVVADEAPDIAEHLPDAWQTVCDALPAAARCLHITDEDCVVLAAKRYEEAAGCIERLWEEVQTAFLGIVFPEGQQGWMSRFEENELADKAWLARMTAADMRYGAADAAKTMLQGVENVRRGEEKTDPNRKVVELLARLPADKLEQKRAVLTIARAEDENRIGRKMVVFEDGSSVGTLGDGLSGEALAKECMDARGWAWITPDEQTGILVEIN